MNDAEKLRKNLETFAAELAELEDERVELNAHAEAIEALSRRNDAKRKHAARNVAAAMRKIQAFRGGE